MLMDDATPTLTLPPAYLAHLIVETRGVQVKEAEVDPDSGSNPVDDKMWDVLQDSRDDLTREEIRERIQGPTEREQAELVALMWIGRVDAEPEEWEKPVQLAQELKEGPTPRYLLRHPMWRNTGRKVPFGWASTCRSARAFRRQRSTYGRSDPYAQAMKSRNSTSSRSRILPLADQQKCSWHG